MIHNVSIDTCFTLDVKYKYIKISYKINNTYNFAQSILKASFSHLRNIVRYCVICYISL